MAIYVPPKLCIIPLPCIPLVAINIDLAQAIFP